MVTRRLRPLRVEGRVDPPDRPAVPLGVRRRGGRRQRQRPDLARGRPEREHARGQGVRLPGRAGPAGRRGPKPTTVPRRPGRRASRSRTRRPRPSPRGGSADDDERLRHWRRPAAAERHASRRAAGRCSERLVEPFRRGRRRTPRRRRASTPTRRCASAARRARSRASSGTSSRPTGSSSPATATTTPARCRPRPGGTSSSSSSSRPRRPVPTCCRRRSRRRWLMMSDVCKHCVAAPCQQACPTGAHHLQRVRQRLHPAGHLQRLRATASPPARSASSPAATIDGHAHKCTLCYDRQKDGLVPACAKACPTASIQFGPVDELRERARQAGGGAARARA